MFLCHSSLSPKKESFYHLAISLRVPLSAILWLLLTGSSYCTFILTSPAWAVATRGPVCVLWGFWGSCWKNRSLVHREHFHFSCVCICVALEYHLWNSSGCFGGGKGCYSWKILSEIIPANVVGGFVAEVNWVEWKDLCFGAFGVCNLKDVVHLHASSIQCISLKICQWHVQADSKRGW